MTVPTKMHPRIRQMRDELITTSKLLCEQSFRCTKLIWELGSLLRLRSRESAILTEIGRSAYNSGLGAPDLRNRIGSLENPRDPTHWTERILQRSRRQRNHKLRQLGQVVVKQMPEVISDLPEACSYFNHLRRLEERLIKIEEQRRNLFPSRAGDQKRIIAGTSILSMLLLFGLVFVSFLSNWDTSKQSQNIARDFHESHKLLCDALQLITNYQLDSSLSNLEQVQEFQRQQVVLDAIAEELGEIGDVETTKQSLEYLKHQKEVRIGGAPLHIDQEKTITSHAVAFAVQGDLVQAENVLTSLNDERVVISGARQAAIARGFHEICRILRVHNNHEGIDYCLEKLQANIPDEAKPIILAQLAKVYALAGRREDFDATITRIRQASENLTEVNEALAEASVAQALVGNLNAAVQIMSLGDSHSIFTDGARYELALYHARTLDFRSAFTIAREIDNDFLRARAFLQTLDRLVLCGPIYAETAAKLSDLADKQLDIFGEDTSLERQIRADHAVVFAKWGLLYRGIGSDELPAEVTESHVLLQIALAKATLAESNAITALESDLTPEQKAWIHASWGVKYAIMNDRQTAKTQFTQALEAASKSNDPEAHVNSIIEIAETASSYGYNEDVNDWGRSQNPVIKAAVQLGIARSVRREEFLRKAVAEGVVLVPSHEGRHQFLSQSNEFWRDFVATVSGDPRVNIREFTVQMSGSQQLLAFPTDVGIAFAFPPNLRGLNGWTAVLSRSDLFRQSDIEMLSKLSEARIGERMESDHLTATKSATLAPSDWIAIVIQRKDDESLRIKSEIDHLIAILASDAEVERKRAVNDLGKIGAPAVEALVGCHTANEQVQREAQRALGAIGAPSIEALRGFLRSDDPRVVEFVCWGLGQYEKQIAAPAIPELLIVLRREATGFYGNMGSFGISTAVGMALVKIGRPAVTPLCEALQHEDGVVAWDILRTLEKMGPEADAAVPTLIHVFDHATPLYQATAVKALGSIGVTTQDVIACLTRGLDSQHSQVRQAAVEALGMLKITSPQIVQSLKRKANDSDEQVREAVDRVLRLIER